MFLFNVELIVKKYLVLFHINLIANSVASASCRIKVEYTVGNECCPSCSPGTHVARHCTQSTSTSCALCAGGSFQDSSNGREQCFSCGKCASGLGLKVKKSCTLTSDTLCEPLDGYFCTDSNRGGCMAAQRHTVCSPGQYISQTGTTDKDTECLHCIDGTFSDGSSTSCQNHTKCESVGLEQTKPGTNTNDSVCREVREHVSDRGHVAVIISGTLLMVVVMLIMILAIVGRKRLTLN